MTRFANAAVILALTVVPCAIVTVQPQAIAHADSCALTNATGALERARFTDVFVLRDGTWMALSAQESTTA